MADCKPLKLAVIGNNLASWLACATFLSLPEYAVPEITLYNAENDADDEDVQSVLPSLRGFLLKIGISEDELKQSSGLPLLGTTFKTKWGDFNHVWGEYGSQRGVVEFQQVLERLNAEGIDIDLNKLSVAASMMERGVYRKPDMIASSIFSTYQNSYSFSTEKLCSLLRKKCIDRGVCIAEDRVKNIASIEKKAYVKNTHNEDIVYDFIINSVATLNGEDLEVEDWSRFLPYQPNGSNNIVLDEYKYSTVVDLYGGFNWRKIQFSEEQCQSIEYTNVERNKTSMNSMGDSILPFHLINPWKGSIVSIGAASVRMKSPIFTDADLIIASLKELMHYYPMGQGAEVVRVIYNKKIGDVYKRLRDAAQLVFIANSRMEVEIFKDLEGVEVSEETIHKLNFFKKRGRLTFYENEVFLQKWQLWMLMGLGLFPRNDDPLLNGASKEELIKIFEAVKSAVKKNIIKVNADFN